MILNKNYLKCDGTIGIDVGTGRSSGAVDSASYKQVLAGIGLFLDEDDGPFGSRAQSWQWCRWKGRTGCTNTSTGRAIGAHGQDGLFIVIDFDVGLAVSAHRD